MTDTVDIPSNELESDATIDATDAVADATGAETTEAQGDAPVEAVVEAPVRVIPDRADAPVSEVTERFLRAVVANVPLELIEELHLFSPLRQGTVETGIAVLAARVPAPVVVMAEPELALDEETVLETQADGVVAAEGSDEQPHAEAERPHADAGQPHAEAGQPHAEHAEELLAENAEELLAAENVEIAEGSPVEEAGKDFVDTLLVAEELVADESVVEGDVVVAEVIADESVDDEVTIEATIEASSGVVHAESIVDDEASDDEIVSVIEVFVPPAPVLRHTVYTARYRYVIKGPERGKWEANVKAEADAPLITVETVVRGVQRRAGEDSEIVRFTQAQIAKALRVVLS